MKHVWEVWSRALPAAECDALVKLAEGYPEQEATVGFSETSRSDLKTRSSIIRWLDVRRETALVSRLMEFVTSSNRTNFGVDIVAPFDVQYTEYHAVNRGHYDWHQDVWLESPRPYARKLSLVVQLSDPADYEGGQFEFFGQQSPGEAFLERGSMLIFPSFYQHRVLPVTSGRRRSLVSWVEGPNWR